MTDKLRERIDNDLEFQSIISDVLNCDLVQEMNNYRQHSITSCFEHCYLASYYCYLICKKHNLDYKSAARAAMVHDLFLYDWRVKSDRKGLHAFTHPKEALKNASKVLELNDVEKDIILNHMWPVTVKLPKTKEGLILTFVDKYCATKETYTYTKKVMKENKMLGYAYTFACIVLLKRPR